MSKKIFVAKIWQMSKKNDWTWNQWHSCCCNATWNLLKIFAEDIKISRLLKWKRADISKFPICLKLWVTRVMVFPGFWCMSVKHFGGHKCIWETLNLASHINISVAWWKRVLGDALESHGPDKIHQEHFFVFKKEKKLNKKIAKVHRTGLMHDNMCGEVTYWKLLWAVNKSLSWGPGTTKWGRQYGQTV